MIKVIHCTVNGKVREIAVDERESLTDMLRLRLGLTSVKKGCEAGECGACTVLVNGARINSCLSLLAMHDGDQVTTIEGLGTAENLHPVQQAFLENDAFQCGYCTPGQICSAVGMLQEAADGWPSQVMEDVAAIVDLSEAEIRERMSGNICRCSAYPQIVAAIRSVAGGAA